MPCISAKNPLKLSQRLRGFQRPILPFTVPLDIPPMPALCTLAPQFTTPRVTWSPRRPSNFSVSTRYFELGFDFSRQNSKIFLIDCQRSKGPKADAPCWDRNFRVDALRPGSQLGVRSENSNFFGVTGFLPIFNSFLFLLGATDIKVFEFLHTPSFFRRVSFFASIYGSINSNVIFIRILSIFR